MGIKLSSLDASLRQWIMSTVGIGPGVGEIFYLADTGDAHYEQLVDLGNVGEANMFTTLNSAVNAMTSYRNDVLVVAPGWYSTIVTTDFDLYDSHIIGASPIPNQSRVDIVHETNAFSPFQTISGRGNTFRNLTFRHGTAEADYVGHYITGRYNYFENVYWMTPMVQAQADHASYIGVHINGHGNYFKGCHFGSDGTARGEVNYNVKLKGRGTVFEDCNFVMMADATTPCFIYLDGADDNRYTYFLNCKFYVHWENNASQIAAAVEVSGSPHTSNLVFDNRCMFVGVDTICASADEACIWVPQTFNSTDLTLGLIGINYDAD